jgi:DNA mismatch endonuclease (patch repair protein)
MVDTLTPLQRSERMSRVRSVNTRPELAVRRIVRALGFSCTLHATDLPGRPDLVFRRRRKLIFVHGCFWHRHKNVGCRLARLPKSRLDFWEHKLEANRLRDIRQRRTLRAAGWKILVVWECQLRNKERLKNKLETFLGATNADS